MDKIKKFKYCDWDIVQKVNELVEAFNQSQKQPEGYPTVDEATGVAGTTGNSPRTGIAGHTEKQEEWREEFKSLLYKWATNGRTKPFYDFISQLLSERIRDAKQETIEDFISELECWKVAWIDRTKDNGAEYLRDGLLKMLNKDLSKLLKEEE